MNKIGGFLFSARLMAVILAVFATSIAIATFIENDFGSLAARAIVYNAHWFEFLLLLGVVNLSGRVILKKLYTRNKISIFLFHISFIIILAGAAITRYSGSEGTMTIREGSATNLVLTDKTYVEIIADKAYQFKVSFNLFGRNRLQKEIMHHGKPVKIKTVGFVSNAYETIEPDKNGIPVAEFIYADSSYRRSLVIQAGDKKTIGSIGLNFSEVRDSLDVNMVISGDSLGFIASFPVTISAMGGESFKILEPGVIHTFHPRQIYSFGDQIIVLNQFYSYGKIVARQVPAEEGQTFDAVMVKLTSNGFTREVFLPGKSGYRGLSRSVNLDGKDIVFSYGSIYKELPFKLKLNDFIVERYPGSHSPSSFESRVELTDSARKISGSYRIYMNNILKYRGYRFYQSSYDADERGTILSVNHDQAGTMVSYAGYALLGLCMFLSLFNRKSRFRSLSVESNRIKQLKNAVSVIILGFLFGSTGIFAQSDDPDIVSPDPIHAASFGRLLVQDNSGRIEPVNTL
ncbi:MAG TPA: cytochrome c biogenesis protein ResB, partial [Bacteroidales bacterium]|nr:cytochrome c biogenesis protein ResB [Bacteroidales bacterium]